MVGGCSCSDGERQGGMGEKVRGWRRGKGDIWVRIKQH